MAAVKAIWLRLFLLFGCENGIQLFRDGNTIPPMALSWIIGKRRDKSTLRHYTAWQKKAGMDAAWAKENPIRIQVEKQGGSYFLRFFPELSF